MADSDGVVIVTADIDLSAATIMNDIINSINAALSGNVTASMITDGQLQLIETNSGEGLANRFI